MYRIEYYTRRGLCVCPIRFETVKAAYKYARLHRERLGAHFVLLSD
jgi:hypothetical protein